ncbi:DNA repair protein RecN (Recombination protein N) [Rubricella aquisinus]|uniref:DNA repair protein RecN n=1 Tax=Rubricella aquisinus TaxID=2028108 RepID=A0A840WLY2_9RHOB|nr:DNA repair protein RecN [Rubricella aquisinus]MBB5516069.1 DNA repair protein RecN (Recombination protein N) [Rubricella aquisinus]
MLRVLSIRNVVLIDALDLEFQPGLNVLTGETGAGKSILLDALGFALGNRTRGDIVRSGADQGSVTAEFDLPPDHPAHSVLAELDLPDEPGEPLILRRVATADGRRSGYINDRRASAEALRQVADTLVEIHGQQDDRGLLDPKVHRSLLDAYAGHPDLTQSVQAAWAAMSKARSALSEARAAREEAARDEDFLRHAVAELDAFAPEPGEDAALDTARRRMQGAEKLRTVVERAAQAISGADGAEPLLGNALRWIEDVAAQSDPELAKPLTDAAEALNRSFAELAEADAGVQAALGLLEYDPLELERCEERLFALRALARKHSVTPDALPDLARDLSGRLARYEQGEDQIATLEADLAQVQARYTSAAEALSAARQEAATRLDAAMAAELGPLKMERAVFVTDISPADHGPSGTDAVTFTVSTNPGAPSGPINRIASGGELSRFLLALKVCLTTRAAGLTMIFDEIDRGVGGATADAVGRRLRALAGQGQVIVVTHSPQVAALGQHHWQIAKSSDGETTLTDVRPLDPLSRVDEIARMLSGDTLTDEARAAARSLIDR